MAGAYRSMALSHQNGHKLLALILFHKKILTLLSGFPYHSVTWLGLTHAGRLTQRPQGPRTKPSKLSLAVLYFFRKPKRAWISSKIKNPPNWRVFALSGDLAGARTQDPLLKREMLYQLSYQVLSLRALPAEALELREAA